jgi:hypothetical protein
MTTTRYVISKQILVELYNQYKFDYEQWYKELKETDWRWRPSNCKCIVNEAVEYKDVVVVDCNMCLLMEWFSCSGKKAFDFCMSLCDADPHYINIREEVIKNASPFKDALYLREIPVYDEHEYEDDE